jgi:hypothetical protein
MLAADGPLEELAAAGLCYKISTSMSRYPYLTNNKCARGDGTGNASRLGRRMDPCCNLHMPLESDATGPLNDAVVILPCHDRAKLHTGMSTVAESIIEYARQGYQPTS